MPECLVTFDQSGVDKIHVMGLRLMGPVVVSIGYTTGNWTREATQWSAIRRVGDGGGIVAAHQFVLKAPIQRLAYWGAHVSFIYTQMIECHQTFRKASCRFLLLYSTDRYSIRLLSPLPHVVRYLRTPS